MSDRDIQPDVQTAALAVACRVLHCDETGRPIDDVGSPIHELHKLAAALETFAAAVVDQAVHAAILPALRAPCETWAEMQARHLREERERIRAALEASAWSLRGAAAELGMPTHTSLQSALRRHPDLDRERRSRKKSP